MPANKNKAKVLEIIERLEQLHGRPDWTCRFEPMDELICTLLSANTNDNNALAAFKKLKARYPTWQEVIDAGWQKVAEVIRIAGLANQKAKHLIQCLSAIKKERGDYNINHLADLPALEGRKWLTQFAGVGPKTASIVLCFCFKKPLIAVDTHVHRVSRRLGFLPEGIDANKAHDVLLEVVPTELAYRYHVALIQHGRGPCKAPIPNCHQCNITLLCEWYKRVGPEKTRAMEQLQRKQKSVRTTVR